MEQGKENYIDKTYFCPFCGNKFNVRKDKARYDVNYMIHTGSSVCNVFMVYSFICPKCLKEFCIGENMWKHPSEVWNKENLLKIIG